MSDHRRPRAGQEVGGERSTTSDTTSEPATVPVEDESLGVAELVDAANDSILAIGVTVQYRQGAGRR